MGDFRKLIGWQKARLLTRDLYSAFKGRRMGEFPGLRAQILRAADSVQSNLAEGCAKGSRRELARFAEMAYASIKEVESRLIQARDAHLLPPSIHADLATKTDEVARICFALSRVPPNDPPGRRRPSAPTDL